jgi:DNA polymerase-3 subunit alpha
LGGGNQVEFNAPTTKPVPDYSQSEKLQLEKELLGFYISNHPLKEISQTARLLAPTNLSDLHEAPENTTITAIALILEVKDITTKKGDRMAVLQLEDLSGSTEAVVFPKSYERIKHLLLKDQRLMVWGKADRRDEQVQLIIDDAQTIEDVQLLKLELTTDQALNPQELHRLREILKAHNGDSNSKIPVIATLQYGEKCVRFGNQFWVNNAPHAATALASAGFNALAESLLPKN